MKGVYGRSSMSLCVGVFQRGALGQRGSDVCVVFVCVASVREEETYLGKQERYNCNCLYVKCVSLCARACA